ncbi:hypothetical protein [Colwellia echini]|uniref:Uncharacterized protein n=1 Tax=Colwellia echini TaxID=1982103 RepID=A0ABY3MXV1_9GAMM|nr:hypothetical protein [Colwellia echini]TYK66019.1 hypothetical protein CWS31_007025 [Colwellia echini]
MKCKNKGGSITDNTHNTIVNTNTIGNTSRDNGKGNTNFIDLLNKTLVPIFNDQVLDPTPSKFIRARASLHSKYHNYFWREDQFCENWKRVQSIFDDYRHLREKALKSPKLKSNDFDNLLSEDNLMFLHRMLTISFVDPANHIESGIDEFEMTFRIPTEWQKNIVLELSYHPEIKEANHYTNKGYLKRYGKVKEYRFKTGGTFVFHRMRHGSKGDCLISFRLSETPWRNIRTFFNCIYEALGDRNYNGFQASATVTRKDPYFLIKGIPLPMLLVDTTSTNNGKKLKRKVFEGIGKLIQGSTYLGDKNSSHTIIYCMYAKLLHLQHKNKKGNKPIKVKELFRKLFNELSSVHCITKIERRINTHQQGSKYGLVKDMHKLRGHTFNKLVFFSPLAFKELSPSIVAKIVSYGLANVRKKLTTKQVKSLNEVLVNPDYKLYFHSKDVVSDIEMKLTKLQRIIQKPRMLKNTLSI